MLKELHYPYLTITISITYNQKGYASNYKLNGDHLTFKGRVYGSVGIEYRIEYDKTAFQVEYNCEYVYSKEDRDMLDGADDSTVTYELTPLKKGLFDIYEVEGFRCQETARKKHTIVVI